MKKKLLFLTIMILCAAGITAATAGLTGSPVKKEGRQFVTSFYPVYLLAQGVAEGAEQVNVTNLTSNHSGCLHDYSLKTEDMRLLSEADLFLVNGGGMELFLTKAASECKGLKIVDTSEGFSFLEGVEHDHDHAEAAGEDNHDADEDHDHDHDALNAHIWMDFDGYLLQLDRVEQALCEADPAQANRYHKNAEHCRSEIKALQKEYEAVKPSLSGNATVVFHEGYIYLFAELGMETLHCLPMDSETQISAGEAAEIVEECRLHQVQVIFTTEEYVDTITKTFGKEVGCKVVALNPITGATKETKELTGIDAYVKAMRDNLALICEAYGVR